MSKHDDIKVSFEIYDFNCSPQELTKNIGVEPTETWLKGDIKYVGPEGKPQAKIKIKNNTWRLASSLPETEPLESHLKYLLDQLMPIKQNLIKVTKNNETQFRCTLLLKDSRPGYYLNKNMLKAIAEINAELDLDIYFLEKD